MRKEYILTFLIILLHILHHYCQKNSHTWRISINQQEGNQTLHIAEVHFYHKGRLHDFSKFNFTASSFRHRIKLTKGVFSGPPQKANDNNLKTFYHNGFTSGSEVVEEENTVSPGFKCCPDPNPILIITTSEDIYIDTIRIFNRQDKNGEGEDFYNRLIGATVTVQNSKNEEVFQDEIKTRSSVHTLRIGPGDNSQEVDRIPTWNDLVDEKTDFETPRQALLISGGKHRFIFRQSRIGGFEKNTDVFIVLHDDGNATTWVDVLDKQLAYDISVPTIKAFFMNLGAETVHVTIISAEDVRELRTRIEKDVGEDKLVELKQDPFYGQRKWQPAVIMFVLRHLVFKTALKFSSSHGFNYTHFLYHREDNVYYSEGQPILPTRDGKMKELCPGSAIIPCIAVSKYCGWGSINEKIFFSNHRGADILFGPTWKDFIAFINAWVYLYNSNQVHNWERMQIEYHYKHWLEFNGGKNLAIHRIDFDRTELRYVHSLLCISEIYIGCNPPGVLNTPWMQELNITIPCSTT
jgi:hypothetical protein